MFLDELQNDGAASSSLEIQGCLKKVSSLFLRFSLPMVASFFANMLWKHP